MDGSRQPPDDIGKGHGGDIFPGLPGEIGNMDEIDGKLPIPEMMEQGIEKIIADEGACRIGNGSGNALCLDRFHQGTGGKRSKIGGGAFEINRQIQGLISFVIGHIGAAQIDGDLLRRDPLSAPGLANAENGPGMNAFRLFDGHAGGFSEYGGQLHFMKAPGADLFRQAFYGFPGRIDAFASKGIKAGDEQRLFFHRNSPRICD